MHAPILETARLQLRDFRESDVPELVPLIGAREIAATTSRIPHPYTEENAKEYIAGCATRSDLGFAIVIRDEQRLCGGVGLHPDPQHQRAELGYWIGVPYWGKGYATEAAAAVARYGFEQLKLARIFAFCFKGNTASQRVLIKLGMRHEGCMRQHVLRWGKIIDLELYAILREEWRAQVK